MAEDHLIYNPVGPDNWTDLEKLFESRGGPHHCWCMVWRNMKEGTNRSIKSGKKESLKNYVEKGIPIGLLCYSGSVPVAWCSIAPRDSYRDLSGDSSLDEVWSLVCFFITREFRHQGVTQKLVTAAMKYAKENGARYVEAYPVDPGSPGYRFMGLKPVFENIGFEFKHKAGKRRNVMTIQL